MVTIISTNVFEMQNKKYLKLRSYEPLHKLVLGTEETKVITGKYTHMVVS